MTTPPILALRDLRVSFQADEGVVRAVDGVSFDVPPNRTVAVVGESGSGKTVISQAILGILPRNASITSGSIWFQDPAPGKGTVDLAQLPQDGPERRAIRGGRISIIFQEPMSSLSPLHTIGDQISEALVLHRGASRSEAIEKTRAMLGRVGFAAPGSAVQAYPFELSGGFGCLLYGRTPDAAIQGVPVLKPAFALASHCIGVRALSRLLAWSIGNTAAGS